MKNKHALQKTKYVNKNLHIQWIAETIRQLFIKAKTKKFPVQNVCITFLKIKQRKMRMRIIVFSALNDDNLCKKAKMV